MKKRAGIIVYNQKEKTILLIKRIKQNQTYWVIPGGTVEADESFTDAALREAAEELNLTNLKASDLSPFIQLKVDSVEHRYAVYRTKQQLEVQIVGEELNRMSPNNQYVLEWISLSEMTALNLKPRACLPFLAQLTNN